MDERDRDDERAGAGHEPGETHDRDFAPVNRDSDARGRTTTGEGATEGGAGGGTGGGTGVPGVRAGHPDALPPDDEGVAEAEAHDDSR